MSDLDIVLKLDPSAPVAGAKAVTAEVAKAEEQGKRTRAAFDSLSKGFASMAQGIRTQTGRALQQTARAFDGLTEAIRREQVMLEKIHGPAKRYAEDLQVLDSLLARNKINTQQYAEQVANLNRQIERSGRATAEAAAKAPAASTAAAPNGLASIASDVGSIKLKQAAGAVNQAFELVNSKLKITESTLGSVIGSAVKFGATGAQIAGPWGAAIGAVAGTVADLVGRLDGGRAAFRQMIEEEQKLAKAYFETKEAAERAKRVESELVPMRAEQARIAQQLTQAEASRSSALYGSESALSSIRAAERAYTEQLSRTNRELAERLRLEGKISGALDDRSQSFFGPYDVEDHEEAQAIIADRARRNEQLKALELNRSYGKTLAELERQEDARINRMRDLEKILVLTNVSQSVKDRALKEHNKLWNEHNNTVKKASDALKELGENQRRVFGGMAIMTAANGNIGTSERPQIAPSKALEEAAQQRARDAEVQRAIREDQRRTRDYYKQIADEQNRLVLNTKKWREEMEAAGSIADTVLNQITSSASELTSHLVDAANGADVSWSDFGRNTLAVFQKLIMQALVLRALTGNVTGQKGAGVDGGYGGLFGLLGFASGGMIYPSGSGTSDSQTVMFRKAPSETVRIHTPSQEAAYRRGGPEGGGGGTTVRVVSEVDRRALYSANDLLVDIGRNRDTIRRLIA